MSQASVPGRFRWWPSRRSEAGARPWRRTSCRSFCRRAIRPGSRGRRRGGGQPGRLTRKKKSKGPCVPLLGRAMLRAMNVQAEVSWSRGHRRRRGVHQPAHRRASHVKSAGVVQEAVRGLELGPAQRVPAGHGVPWLDAGPAPGKATSSCRTEQHAPPNPLAKRSRPPAAADIDRASPCANA